MQRAINAASFIEYLFIMYCIILSNFDAFFSFQVVLGDSQMHYMSVHHAEKCGAKFFDKENIGSPPLLNTVICLMCKHSSKLWSCIWLDSSRSNWRCEMVWTYKCLSIQPWWKKVRHDFLFLIKFLKLLMSKSPIFLEFNGNAIKVLVLLVLLSLLSKYFEHLDMLCYWFCPYH